MIDELSAGGVVIFGNAILLLKKFNGDFVLPKGRLEQGESLGEAGIREVEEESGVKAEILEYIGRANYKYRNYKQNQIVRKTVHWYLMTTKSMDRVPQKSEGFIDVIFVHIDRAAEMLKYDDERRILEKGIEIFRDKYWE